jgi:hypothetical protein
MSSTYLDSIKRLINRNGNDDLSLITYTTTIDPTNPLNVINTTTTDLIYSYIGHYKEKEMSDGTIGLSDIKLYVDPSSLTTEPTIENKITDGTTTYNIQRVTKWKDKDTVVLYVLQIRE